MSATFFVAGNIEQVKELIDVLKNAVAVAELAESLDCGDPVRIKLESKKYYDDENSIIEYDAKIEY